MPETLTLSENQAECLEAVRIVTGGNIASEFTLEVLCNNYAIRGLKKSPNNIKNQMDDLAEFGLVEVPTHQLLIAGRDLEHQPANLTEKNWNVLLYCRNAAQNNVGNEFTVGRIVEISAQANTNWSANNIKHALDDLVDLKYIETATYQLTQAGKDFVLG